MHVYKDLRDANQFVISNQESIKKGALLFEQVQRVILAKKIFWG